jgi:hypothetical protein
MSLKRFQCDYNEMGLHCQKKGNFFESYEDLKGWDKKYQNDFQPFGREFANQIMTNSKT